MKGQISQASLIWKYLCRLQERRLGLFHKATYATYLSYGKVLMRMDRWKQVEEFWEGVIKQREAVVGRTGVEILHPTLQLCESLRKQYKVKKLKEKESECLILAKQVYGEEIENMEGI